MVVIRLFKFGRVYILLFGKGLICNVYAGKSNRKVMEKSRPNPGPEDKILALTKLQSFADDNFIVGQMIYLFSGMTENIAGIGENAGYQHFLLFQKGVLRGTEVSV